MEFPKAVYTDILYTKADGIATIRVRFKVMCRRVRGIHRSERPEMKDRNQMSDEEMLHRLSAHPQ
ncbi:MAG: hypothetical protein WA012_08825, partial [Rhodoferax sp.]|uniref:hypothetical protein n=1 Tax=Rhodoferax sp. TaxID=50421 RepID=UPI003BB14C76